MWTVNLCDNISEQKHEQVDKTNCGHGEATVAANAQHNRDKEQNTNAHVYGCRLYLCIRVCRHNRSTIIHLLILSQLKMHFSLHFNHSN